MKIKTSGRSALVLATGLWVCCAGPSQAAADADNAAAASPKSETSETTVGAPVALSKYTKHNSKKHAHRKSSKVALKSSDNKKADATEVADDRDNSAMIPPWVANANAQLASVDTPTGNARAMSARANNILQAAPVDPADAPPAAEAQIVAADQLNDVDRALHASTPPAPTPAPASADAPVVPAPVAPVMASSKESSTWDQTSVIGKVFIGFGALLTMASAARMFIA